MQDEAERPDDRWVRRGGAVGHRRHATAHPSRHFRHGESSFPCDGESSFGRRVVLGTASRDFGTASRRAQDGDSAGCAPSTMRSRLASRGWPGSSGRRTKSAVVTDATSRSSAAGHAARPAATRRGLGVDQRAAVGGVERAQPRPVVQAEHHDVDETGLDQQLGQLGRRQLPRVERVERRVAAGGERDPVRRREQQRAAGGQHPSALAQEPLLVPEVLDDLQRHHRVDTPSRTGSATRLARAAATRG